MYSIFFAYIMKNITLDRTLYSAQWAHSCSKIVLKTTTDECEYIYGRVGDSYRII